MQKYEKEARERWGDTEAYREYTEKTKDYSRERYADAGEGLMAIFAEVAAIKDSGADAESAEARVLVKKLQAYITENFYTCTDDILQGLGQTYVCDERFKKNIDKYGEGTAEFAAEAIAAYTEKR